MRMACVVQDCYQWAAWGREFGNEEGKRKVKERKGKS